MQSELRRRFALPSLVAFVFLTSGCGLIPKHSDLPPSQQAFHPVNFAEAVEFAERAKATYADAPQLPGQVVVRDLKNSEVRYILSRSGGRQHVAIRGTSNVRNAIIDVQARPDFFATGITAHQGFGSATSEVVADLRPRLQKSQPITITGHSLGGAIATLLAIQLHDDGYTIDRVITFGQPKVTDEEGARKNLDLPITRFVNDDDPVVDLPPALVTKSGKWRYTHIGEAVILRGDRGYIFLEPLQGLAHGVRSFFDQLGDSEVPDHKMDEYFEHLVRRVSGSQEMPIDVLK